MTFLSPVRLRGCRPRSRLHPTGTHDWAALRRGPDAVERGGSRHEVGPRLDVTLGHVHPGLKASGQSKSPWPWCRTTSHASRGTRGPVSDNRNGRHSLSPTRTWRRPARRTLEWLRAKQAGLVIFMKRGWLDQDSPEAQTSYSSGSWRRCARQLDRQVRGRRPTRTTVIVAKIEQKRHRDGQQEHQQERRTDAPPPPRTARVETRYWDDLGSNLLRSRRGPQVKASAFRLQGGGGGDTGVYPRRRPAPEDERSAPDAGRATIPTRTGTAACRTASSEQFTM